eukprot:CAMPEP_0173379682 /NCGR_PEP_ID=MMETSP1356-20130122/2527_1 /TAXON_ID=77927 ORGANISM="Hemiselmis virescens, Strain PCC157" /NCGR_SAMPLE_ID=MMETSP1356 /ASSEMBLY_ACC=CAM_ASM_000847 /LENGTH=105 /DNA_ID=CAMNT_0014333057 /DNA_START=28 /DNA_END=347 /DNA_ORIENTATION=+
MRDSVIIRCDGASSWYLSVAGVQNHQASEIAMGGDARPMRFVGTGMKRHMRFVRAGAMKEEAEVACRPEGVAVSNGGGSLTAKARWSSRVASEGIHAAVCSACAL